MKLYESKFFGKLKEPENINELFSIILDKKGKSFTNVFYWRGQSNIDWRIDSSGYRRIINSKMHSNKHEDI